MPTALRRVQVTIDKDLADALVGAEKEWPGRPQAEQIARLAKRGSESLTVARTERRAARRKALEETQGIFGRDVYPENYLEDLRAEWPE